MWREGNSVVYGAEEGVSMPGGRLIGVELDGGKRRMGWGEEENGLLR